MVNKVIVFYSTLTVICLFIIGQLMPSSYYTSLLVKLVLFLLLPMFFSRRVMLDKIRLRVSPTSLAYIGIMSALIILSIIVAYYLVASYIDISLIQNDFTDRQKIQGAMYLFPVLYTIFINSFIEEFFFRGFMFQGLEVHKGFAAIFSSMLFAVYHVGIFISWFTVPVLLLALTGLFLGGLIFSYAVHKTKSLLASYLIHMSADVGVVVVGVFLMKIFT